MTGHQRLVEALELLLLDVRKYEFHDFRNTTYAAPKNELVRRLRELEDSTKRGRYDNRPGEDI